MLRIEVHLRSPMLAVNQLRQMSLPQAILNGIRFANVWLNVNSGCNGFLVLVVTQEMLQKKFEIPQILTEH